MKNLELKFPDHKYIIHYFDQEAKEAIDIFDNDDAIKVDFIPYDELTETQARKLMHSTKHELIKKINEIIEINEIVYEDIKYNCDLMALRIDYRLGGVYIEKIFIEFSLIN